MRSLGSVSSSIVRDTQDAMAKMPAGADPAPQEPRTPDADKRTLLDRWKFILALARDAGLGRAALATGIFILESRDKRTDVYACTYGQIATGVSVDRSTAIRAVDALVARGWFLRLSGGRTKGGAKAPNRYIPQWSRAG